jgi:hypothetical protein
MLGWAAELKKKTQPKRPSIVSLFGMVSYSSLHYEDLVRTSFCWGWELSYLGYIFLVMVFTGYASAIWKTGILRWTLMILVVADCTWLQEGRTWAWCTPLFTNYSCYCMVFVYRHSKFRCSKQWRGGGWHTHGRVKWRRHPNCLIILLYQTTKLSLCQQQ